MPVLLCIQCENFAECGSVIFSDEECDCHDGPRNSLRVVDGQRLEYELNTAAQKAGWIFNGLWMCKSCFDAAVDELAEHMSQALAERAEMN